MTAPAKFVEKYEDGEVEAGDSYSFKAAMKGQPTPTVSWFFKSNEIQDEGRFLIESTDKYVVLDISEIERSDEGEYVCRISNEAGEDTCSATLRVLGNDGF